jgi:endogenous inhibitor of DNA gyrase (YacG/DUF329 family)
MDTNKALNLIQRITGTRKVYEKVCEMCATEFATKRKEQKFCSKKCKSRFNGYLHTSREVVREVNERYKPNE